MGEGFLYFADSVFYQKEATVSALRLKQVHPQSRISIISDEQANGPFENTIPLPSENTGLQKTIWQGHKKTEWKLGLLRRVKSLSLTPYERTLYLDSDTYLVEKCNDLFALLDYFDICLAKAPLDRSAVEFDGRVLASAEPHNCGVILFNKNERVFNLFSAWYDRYLEQLKNSNPGADQAAFEQTMIDSSVRVYTLSNLWDARARYPLLLLGKVKILHVRSEQPEALARAINASSELRLWNPVTKSCNVIKETRG